MRKHKRGFVLLELLTVIAIIGILAAILLPALSRARETGRRGSCLVNLQQMGMVLRMYADENDRYLPWSGGVNNAQCIIDLYGDYITTHEGLMCPSDSNSYDWDEDDAGPVFKTTVLDAPNSPRASYDYLGAYTDEALRYPHPSKPIQRIPIMWDLWSGVAYDEDSNVESRYSPSWANHIPGGGNILYMDGSVEFNKYEKWADWNLPEGVPNLAMSDPSARTPEEQQQDADLAEYEASVEAEAKPFTGRFGTRLPAKNTVKAQEEKAAVEMTDAEREKVLKNFMDKKKPLKPVGEKKSSAAQKSWRWIKRNVFYTN